MKSLTQSLISVRLLFRSGNASRLLSNFSWQTGTKLLNLLMSVIAGGLVARHLTHDLSQYRVAQFYVSLVTPFTVVVNNNVIMRRLITSEDEGRVLGSASRLIAGCGAFFFILISGIGLVWGGAPAEKMLYVVTASSLLIWWPVPFGHALDAHLHGRESALSNSIGSLGLRTWEICCSLLGVSIVWLAGSATFGMGLTMLMFIWFYHRLRGHKTTKWTWDAHTAFELFRESLPLILGGLASSTLFRLNLVLLQSWSGDAEASRYSVALELPLSAQMIANILFTVFFPGLINVLSNEPIKAWRRLEQFTRLGVAVGISGTVILYLGSTFLSHGIYGSHFDSSASVLQVTALLLPAFFAAQGRGIWLLHTRQTQLELYYIFGGIIVDLVVASFLVPKYGAIGAAWSLVAAYYFTWLFSSFLHVHTRRIGIIQLRALFWPVPSIHELGKTDKQSLN
jgi:O-antigen/teichoic acid export membrane protein